MASIKSLKQAIIHDINLLENLEELERLHAVVKGMSEQHHPAGLSEAQQLMLEMALADIEAGRLISQDEVDRMDEKWLNE